MTDDPTAYFVEDPAGTDDETDGFVLCRDHRGAYLGTAEPMPVRTLGEEVVLSCAVCGDAIVAGDSDD